VTIVNFTHSVATNYILQNETSLQSVITNEVIKTKFSDVLAKSLQIFGFLNYRDDIPVYAKNTQIIQIS